MKRDFVPEGRSPDPDLPRHARDFYPAGTAPRGFGQRADTDFVPAGGRAPTPPVEEERPAQLPEPKAAPALENDFVPGVKPDAEERLPLGFVVDVTEDGIPLVVAGYDKRGRMLVREQQEEAPEEAAAEAGAKGGEVEEEQARTEEPTPKRAPKKKKDEE
jgi:hypothetical protein